MHGSPHPYVVAQIIEGEQYAEAVLSRVKTGAALPDDLAATVEFLTGEMRRAFCRRIQKVVEVAHA